MAKADWRPMLAVPSTLPPDPSAFAFEYKWDGMRALVAVRKGELRILSRNGLDQAARFPELAGIAAALRGYKCVFTMPDKMSQEKVRLLK
ncbi:MAG: hypothetical protein ABR562_05165, partial [Thermoplasmatota archaeon]